MRSSLCVSLAIGLLSIDSAVANLCRPRPSVTTPDASLSLTTPVSIETPSGETTELPIVTPSAETTELPIVTPVATPSPIETPSASSDTVIGAPEPSIVTSASTQSSAVSSSSTAALTVPTAFNIVASLGPAANKALHGRAYAGLYQTFNGEYGVDVPIAFEASTGRLRAFDNGLYLCALYNFTPNTASFVTCTTSSADRPYVTCEPPTGAKLECSIPACRWEGRTEYGEPGSDSEGPYTVYSRVCDADAEPWSNFYTRVYTGSPNLQWLADIGPEGATGDATLTALDFLVEAI